MLRLEPRTSVCSYAGQTYNDLYRTLTVARQELCPLRKIAVSLSFDSLLPPGLFLGFCCGHNRTVKPNAQHEAIHRTTHQLLETMSSHIYFAAHRFGYLDI